MKFAYNVLTYSIFAYYGCAFNGPTSMNVTYNGHCL